MSNPQDKALDPAERYVAELMDGGHAVAPGQFTMDREFAQRKLSEFQLPDPAFYVLLLLRSAILQGAHHVTIRTDSRGVSLRFNGAPYGRQDLHELYDIAMSGKTDPRSNSLRALALGLRTVTGLAGFLSLDVISGDDGGATRLRLEPGRGEGLEDAPPGIRGTAIAVRFAGRGSVEAPEVDVIDRRCGYADGEIYVNGRDVTQGLRLRLDEAVLADTFDHNGVRGATGFAPDHDHGAELRLVRDGVLLATHELDVPDARFLAVLDAGDLTLDLSQFDVIRDDVYAERVSLVKRLYSEYSEREDLETQCRQWVEKRAARQLGQIEALLHANAIKLFGSAALVSVPALVAALLGAIATGWGGPAFPGIVALGSALVIIPIIIVGILRRSRIQQPAVELAAKILPVGSRQRAAALRQAKRQGGAIARVLK